MGFITMNDYDPNKKVIFYGMKDFTKRNVLFGIYAITDSNEEIQGDYGSFVAVQVPDRGDLETIMETPYNPNEQFIETYFLFRPKRGQAYKFKINTAFWQIDYIKSDPANNISWVSSNNYGGINDWNFELKETASSVQSNVHYFKEHMTPGSRKSGWNIFQDKDEQAGRLDTVSMSFAERVKNRDGYRKSYFDYNGYQHSTTVVFGVKFNAPFAINFCNKCDPNVNRDSQTIVTIFEYFQFRLEVCAAKELDEERKCEYGEIIVSHKTPSSHGAGQNKWLKYTYGVPEDEQLVPLRRNVDYKISFSIWRLYPEIEIRADVKVGFNLAILVSATDETGKVRQNIFLSKNKKTPRNSNPFAGQNIEQSDLEKIKVQFGRNAKIEECENCVPVVDSLEQDIKYGTADMYISHWSLWKGTVMLSGSCKKTPISKEPACLNMMAGTDSITNPLGNCGNCPDGSKVTSDKQRKVTDLKPELSTLSSHSSPIVMNLFDGFRFITNYLTDDITQKVEYKIQKITIYPSWNHLKSDNNDAVHLATFEGKYGAAHSNAKLTSSIYYHKSNGNIDICNIFDNNGDYSGHSSGLTNNKINAFHSVLDSTTMSFKIDKPCTLTDCSTNCGTYMENTSANVPENL